MAYDLEKLGTRLEVEDVVVRLFVATDERDWPTLEGCLADPFMLDMTSLVGGAPAALKPGEVSAAWAEGFKAIDHVHHQAGQFQTTVTGETATVTCHGVAFHHRAGISAGVKTRLFVGTYVFDLARSNGRWRVTRMVFKLKFLEGNLALETAL